MPVAAVAFDDVRIYGRRVTKGGGVRLVRQLCLGTSAIATVGLGSAFVLVTAGWLMGAVSPQKHSIIARENFGLRHIALALPHHEVARGPGPADIIVFPQSFVDAEPADAERLAAANAIPVPRAAPPALLNLRTAATEVLPAPPMPTPAPHRVATSRPAQILAKVSSSVRAAATKVAALALPSAPAAHSAAPPPAVHTVSVPPRADTPPKASASDGRTAIYDITAQVVYLPSGRTLEAHSGLGSSRDDPRYIGLKMRGPTPPNTYDLSLRESLFHGVRAIRLTPRDDDKMFGRAGMLAHTYMLGPGGDSNGCVSFKDYDAFLQAYLKGEVDRLIVVPRHGAVLARSMQTPSPVPGGARFAAIAP